MNQLISKEDSIFDRPLYEFTLKVRLSTVRLDVAVTSHKREESTKLVEHDVKFVWDVSKEPWDVGSNERDARNS